MLGVTLLVYVCYQKSLQQGKSVVELSPANVIPPVRNDTHFLWYFIGESKVYVSI